VFLSEREREKMGVPVGRLRGKREVSVKGKRQKMGVPYPHTFDRRIPLRNQKHRGCKKQDIAKANTFKYFFFHRRDKTLAGQVNSSDTI
jgi:hypothetical protein